MVNSIISNTAAFSAQGNIGRASESTSASIGRLSSGNRINKASDDVAGLAVGTALRTQVTTLRTALANAAQGSSLLQVADGALSQIIDILQRQKAIAVQSSSGQLTDANRSLLNQEFQALTAEVDRLATGTNFNGVNLLAGGLGNKTSIVRTNALAGSSFVAAPSLGGGTNITPSTLPINFFNMDTGALRTYAAANAGTAQLVDATGAALANNEFSTVDASVYGQFSKFEFSNPTFGAVGIGTATLTATLNGVKYSGTVIANATASAVLQNGNTFIQLALGNVALTDGAAAQVALNNITNIFSTTQIARTNTLQGVDFEGTRLDGVVGSPGTAVASIRLANNGQADISDFAYSSNSGAVNTSVLSVKVNGEVWTATGVVDNIVAGGNLTFRKAGSVELLNINTTGLTSAITNIRTDLNDRTAFINALNTGFSRAGGGLNFAIGSTTSDSIRIQFESATTNTLFNGQPIAINTAANALSASVILDNALTKVVSLRANVGALQSRFNFASNAIQSSIENQDSARGVLLDTDVSAESTAYASAQVQLQAGISVLAQANQLPQSLLKLLG
jgi:flagellin